MWGPKFELSGQNHSLVLRDISHRDNRTLPHIPSATVLRHLSSDAQGQVVEILAYGAGARAVGWMENGRDRVVWGVHAKTETGEVCVGFSGFNAVPMRQYPSEAKWYEVESYTTLLNQNFLGQKIATATHSYRTAFGFALGLDCFRASIIKGNELSRRALLRAGYLEFGEAPKLDVDGRQRLDFRLYNPRLAALAVDHAMLTAAGYGNSGVTPAAVKGSMEYITAVQQALPHVREATEKWLGERADRLMYLPGGQ
ncbi:MAG TPA: GNAT family protein [Candidatus Saccharimonadales bacterium]|nr:GNAT family protein [Candidatus Saccharimonadales bacterium]